MLPEFVTITNSVLKPTGKLNEISRNTVLKNCSLTCHKQMFPPLTNAIWGKLIVDWYHPIKFERFARNDGNTIFSSVCSIEKISIWYYSKEVMSRTVPFCRFTTVIFQYVLLKARSTKSILCHCKHSTIHVFVSYIKLKCKTKRNMDNIWQNVIFCLHYFNRRKIFYIGDFISLFWDLIQASCHVFVKTWSVSLVP